LFRNATLLGVRDATFSLEKLREVNALHKNCLHSGDDALLLPPEFSAAAQNLHEALPQHELLLAVNFRDSSTYQKGFPKPATAAMAKVLEDFFQQHSSVQAWTVPISYNAQDDDRKASRALWDLLPEPEQSRLSLIEQELRAPELRALLGKSHLAIGVSYHFLLFCLSANIPALGLFANPYYEAKTRGLMELYGMSEWAIDIRNGFDSALIASKLEALKTKREALSQQLRLRNQELRSQESQFHDRLFSLISEGHADVAPPEN
jgi:polysaccharide pyruvyl transferase WcaK-like protein